MSKTKHKKKPDEPVARFLRLNVGAGDTKIEGFIAVDERLGTTAYPLAYADGTVDEIRASHVLEHFPHGHVIDVLKDWYRALKPGGQMRIAVPDMKWIADRISKDEPIGAQGLIYGGQDYAENVHMSGFTVQSLREAMVNVGLERISPWASEIPDCAAQPFSLNLAGWKPVTEDKKITGIRAVGATARFGPSLHHICTDRGLAALGIIPEKMQGCFWHQNLSFLIESVLADPSCEYVITLDYDSMFRPDDVVELYRLMRAYPEVDALVPVEMKRGDNCPLFSIVNDKGIPQAHVPISAFEENLIRVATGHFGLTMFRASKLRAMPKPWMNAIPAPDGGWGDGHVDADINFWHNWTKAGNTIYLANKVQVGHLEESIVWAGKGFTPVYQTMNDYMKNGRPAEARIT